MKKLNFQYRKKNKSTDVLSFEVHHQKLLGNIIIDVDTAKSQSKDYQHSFRREILELFVHGCLHLRGFDHETTPKAAKMKKWEQKFSRKLDQILSRL